MGGFTLIELLVVIAIIPAEVISLVDEAETLDDGFFVPFWCPGNTSQWPRPRFVVGRYYWATPPPTLNSAYARCQ